MSTYIEIDDTGAVRGVGGRIVGLSMGLAAALAPKLARIAELEAADPFGDDEPGRKVKGQYNANGVPPAEALELREVPVHLQDLGTEIIEAMGTYEAADADATARFRAVRQV